MLHIFNSNNKFDSNNYFINTSSKVESKYNKNKKDKNSESLFLVYIDEKYGLIGGAKLQPLTKSNISRENKISLGLVNEHRIWECSKVFFDIEGLEGADRYSPEAQALMTKFYAELYKGLQHFSNECNIRMIITVHENHIHEELRYQGAWPFLNEVSIQNKSNMKLSSCVVGVLSMEKAPIETLIQAIALKKVMSSARLATA